jgi:hypothetical protein
MDLEGWAHGVYTIWGWGLHSSSMYPVFLMCVVGGWGVGSLPSLRQTIAAAAMWCVPVRVLQPKGAASLDIVISSLGFSPGLVPLALGCWACNVGHSWQENTASSSRGLLGYAAVACDHLQWQLRLCCLAVLPKQGAGESSNNINAVPEDFFVAVRVDGV